MTDSNETAGLHYDIDELEEWRKRQAAKIDSLSNAGTLTSDEVQELSNKPSLGTKLSSAFGTDFAQTAVSKDLPAGLSAMLDAAPLGIGDALRSAAATSLIPNWAELSEEERGAALTDILESKNRPEPLLDFTSRMREESRQIIANKKDPSHKDYDPEYHSYVNWQHNTSITEDGMFNPEVMQKVILQGLPSLATSMTAGFIGGLIGGPGGAIAAATATTFGLEGSSEYKEAVNYYEGEGYTFKEASHLAARSAAAYGLAAAVLETLPAGRIFTKMFGATDDIARATNKGLFNRALRKTSEKLGKGVDDYNDYVENGLGKFIDRTVVQGAVEAIEEGSQYMTQTAIQAGYRDESFGELFDWDEFLESAWGGALLGIGSGTTGSLVEETQVVQKVKDRFATPESGGLQVKQQEDGTYATILYGPEPVKEGEEVDDSVKPKMVETWRSEPFDTYKEANEERDRALGLFRKAKAEGKEGAFLDKPNISMGQQTAANVIFDEQVKPVGSALGGKKGIASIPPIGTDPANNRSNEAIILLSTMGQESSLSPKELERLEVLKKDGISGDQVEKSLTKDTLKEANVSPEEAMKIAEEMALNVPEDISSMVGPPSDPISPLETPQGDPSDIPTITGDPSIGPTGPVIEPEGPAIEPEVPTPPVITPTDDTAPAGPGPVPEPTGPPGSEQLGMFGPEEFPGLSPEKAEEMKLAKKQDMIDDFTMLVDDGGDIASHLAFKNIEALETLSNSPVATKNPEIKAQIEAAITLKKSKLPKRQSKGFKGGPNVPSRRTLGILREKLGLTPEEPEPSPEVSMQMVKIAENLYNKTGIKATFINNITKVDKYGNPIKAYVEEREDGAMVPVINLAFAAESDVFHEYVHVVLAAMRSENPTAFKSLWNSMKKEAWFSELVADIRARYDYELRDATIDDLMEEVMAHAVGWLANDQYKNKIPESEHQSFKDMLIEFIKAIANAMNNLFGTKIFNVTHSEFESVEISKILDMSLKDFVDLMASTERKIDLENAWYGTGLKLADPKFGVAALMSHPAFYEDAAHTSMILDGGLNNRPSELEEMWLKGEEMPTVLDSLFLPFRDKLKVPKGKYRPRKRKHKKKDPVATLQDVSRAGQNVISAVAQRKITSKHYKSSEVSGDNVIFPEGFNELLGLYLKASDIVGDSAAKEIAMQEVVDFVTSRISSKIDGASIAGSVKYHFKEISNWIQDRLEMNSDLSNLVMAYNSVDLLLTAIDKNEGASINISERLGTENNPDYLMKKGRLTVSEIEHELINQFSKALFEGKIASEDLFSMQLGYSLGGQAFMGDDYKLIASQEYIEANKNLSAILDSIKNQDRIKLSTFTEIYSKWLQVKYGVKVFNPLNPFESTHQSFFKHLGLKAPDIKVTHLHDNHMPFKSGHTFDYSGSISGNGFVWYVLGGADLKSTAFNQAVLMEVQSDILPEFFQEMQYLTSGIEKLNTKEEIDIQKGKVRAKFAKIYLESLMKYSFPFWSEENSPELLNELLTRPDSLPDQFIDSYLKAPLKNLSSDVETHKHNKGIDTTELNAEKFWTRWIMDILVVERSKDSLVSTEHKQFEKDIIDKIPELADKGYQTDLAGKVMSAMNQLAKEDKLPFYFRAYTNIPGIKRSHTPAGGSLDDIFALLFPNVYTGASGYSMGNNLRKGNKNKMLRVQDGNGGVNTVKLSEYIYGKSKYFKKKRQEKIAEADRFINSTSNIMEIFNNTDGAIDEFVDKFLNWSNGMIGRYDEYMDNVYMPALDSYVDQRKEELDNPDLETSEISPEELFEMNIFNRLYISGSAQRMAIQHAMQTAKLSGYDRLYVTGGWGNAVGETNSVASSLYYTEVEANIKILSSFLNAASDSGGLPPGPKARFFNGYMDLLSDLVDNDAMGRHPGLFAALESTQKQIETNNFGIMEKAQSIKNKLISFSSSDTKKYKLIAMHFAIISAMHSHESASNREFISELITHPALKTYIEYQRADDAIQSKKTKYYIRKAPSQQAPIPIQTRKVAGKKNVRVVNSVNAGMEVNKGDFNLLVRNPTNDLYRALTSVDDRVDGDKLLVSFPIDFMNIVDAYFTESGVEMYEIDLNQDIADKPFKRLSKMDKPLDDDSQQFTIEPGSRAYDQVYNKIDSAYKRSVGKVRGMGQTIEHNKIVAAIGEMIPSKYKNVFDDWLIKKMDQLGDNFDTTPHRIIDNSQNILSTQETNEILRSSESEFIDDMNGDGDIDVSTMTKSLYKIERKAFKALGVTLTLDEEARLLSKAQEIKDFDTWMQLIVADITGRDPKVMKASELLAYKRLHLSVNNQVRVNHPDSLMNEKSNIIIELHDGETLVYGKGEKTRMFLVKAIDDQYNSNPSNPKRERTTLVYHKYLSGEYKSRLVFLNGSDILAVVGKPGQGYQKLRESYDVLTDSQLKAMLWDKFLPLDIVPISTRGEEGGLIFARITQEHKDHTITPTSLKAFWDKQIAAGYITEKDAAEMINTIAPMRAGNIARFLAMNEVIPGFMVVKETNEAGQEVITSADAANIFKRIKIPFTPTISNGDMEATNMVLVDKEDIMFSFPESTSKLGGMVTIKGLGRKYRADGATLTSRSAFNKMGALGLKPGASKAKTVMYQKDGDNVIAVKHEHFALEPGMKIWKKSGALIGEVNDKGDIIGEDGELIDFISTNDEAKIYKGYEENIKNQAPITFIGRSIGLIKYADRERPNATHPHQWYNYVRNTEIQRLVADHYINDENSPVKRILRQVFQIANSVKSIEEFADQLDRNIPDVSSLILIEKARAGAGLHPDIALFFDNLVQARFASKAMSLEIGEGTYLDIMPNFRGDLKENDIALSMDNARPLVADWANDTNNDIKDATIEAINEWLLTQDYRVLASRFPIPHLGGVSYARVKRLHAFKGVVEASPVMVFKRKEGDHDGDAMQIEFMPPGEMHEELRAYIDSVHKNTKAIDLNRFADKTPFSYANIADVYRLKASIAYGGKAIQSVAAIQNVYGIMQDVFEGVTIDGPNGGTWTLIPGDRVVDLDFMEEGYSDTVNQKLRILLQAAVDNAQYMLLSKWNFDRNELLLSLFETIDARGNTINLSDAPADTKALAETAIKAIYKEIRRVGFIRNGGDFQSKSWGFADLITNSEIYNEFTSDRESYMATIFSEAGIKASVNFNNSLAVLEQMAVTPFQMYERYRKNHQLNSPYVYDDIVYENIHQDVLSEWDTEAKRVELIAQAVETDIGLGNYSNKQAGARHAEAGVSYAKRMGKVYYGLMDTLKGKMYPTTWDHNQEVREFMLEFDEEFKSLTEVGKYMATLEFLRGVKKLDGTRVYNVKFIPPYSHSPSLPSLLSVDIMQEYNKLYNDHLLEKDGRTRDPEKRRDMINRATNSELARRICLG
jgi:hypothetical protein